MPQCTTTTGLKVFGPAKRWIWALIKSISASNFSTGASW